MGANHSLTSDAAFPPQEPIRSRAEQQALEALERERKEESEAKTTVWAFIWTLFVFKVATMILIVYIAAGSTESLSVAFATTWYWFIIPIVAVTGPLLYRWRLITQRRRREALRNAEWMVDHPKPAAPGAGEGDIVPEHITIVIHRPDDDQTPPPRPA